MKEQRITIEIDHDGRVKADADGFSGDACLRELERLLEGVAPVVAVDRKPDAAAAKVTTTRTMSVEKKK